MQTAPSHPSGLVEILPPSGSPQDLLAKGGFVLPGLTWGMPPSLWALRRVGSQSVSGLGCLAPGRARHAQKSSMSFWKLAAMPRLLLFPGNSFLLYFTKASVRDGDLIEKQTVGLSADGLDSWMRPCLSAFPLPLNTSSTTGQAGLGQHHSQDRTCPVVRVQRASGAHRESQALVPTSRHPCTDQGPAAQATYPERSCPPSRSV